MISGKREIRDSGTDSEIRKKARRKKKLVCWLLVDLTVAVIVFALLLYKPGRYKPVGFGSGDDGQVSPYLTHELSPQLYNGAQRDEPFELVITQDGVNEIVAELGWPKMSQGILLYSPAVLFVPESIVLMVTADVKGVKFVITVALEPKIDEQELLNLQVSAVKIGAMNITPLARMIAKKMYAQRLATLPVDTEALQTKIVASLLNGEPFEPVFRLEKRKVRLENVAIQEGELIAHLVPAS